MDQFLIQDSLKLSEIEKLAAKGSLEEHILLPDQMFPECPKIKADRKFDKMLEKWQPSSMERGCAGRNGYGCITAAESLSGIYQWQEERKLYKPGGDFFFS